MRVEAEEMSKTRAITDIGQQDLEELYNAIFGALLLFIDRFDSGSSFPELQHWLNEIKKICGLDPLSDEKELKMVNGFRTMEEVKALAHYQIYIVILNELCRMHNNPNEIASQGADQRKKTEFQVALKRMLDRKCQIVIDIDKMVDNSENEAFKKHLKGEVAEQIDLSKFIGLENKIDQELNTFVPFGYTNVSRSAVIPPKEDKEKEKEADQTTNEKFSKSSNQAPNAPSKKSKNLLDKIWDAEIKIARENTEKKKSDFKKAQFERLAELQAKSGPTPALFSVEEPSDLDKAWGGRKNVPQTPGLNQSNGKKDDNKKVKGEKEDRSDNSGEKEKGKDRRDNEVRVEAGSLLSEVGEIEINEADGEKVKGEDAERDEENNERLYLIECVKMAALGNRDIDTLDSDKNVDHYLEWTKKHAAGKRVKFSHFGHGDEGKDRAQGLIVELIIKKDFDHMTEEAIQRQIQKVYNQSSAYLHSFSRYLFAAFHEVMDKDNNPIFSLTDIQKLYTRNPFGISFADIKKLPLFAQGLAKDQVDLAVVNHQLHRSGIRGLRNMSTASRDVMFDLKAASSDEQRYAIAMKYICNNPNKAFAKCLYDVLKTSVEVRNEVVSARKNKEPVERVYVSLRGNNKGSK